MNRVPDPEMVLIPGGSLLTATAEEGRALALRIARHTIHNIQPDLDALRAGRFAVRGFSGQPDRGGAGRRHRVPDDCGGE